jgi:hypothetical protein
MRKRVNIVDVVPHNSDMSEGEKHLRTFMHAVVSDEQPPPATSLFLARAFQKILRGEDPKKALALITGQGTKATAARARRYSYEVNIAVMVEERIAAGMTKDDARQAVADDLGLSYGTVRDHHKPNEVMAKSMIKMFDELEQLKQKK